MDGSDIQMRAARCFNCFNCRFLEYPQFLTPRNDLALDFIGRGRFFGGGKKVKKWFHS